MNAPRTLELENQLDRVFFHSRVSNKSTLRCGVKSHSVPFVHYMGYKKYNINIILYIIEIRDTATPSDTRLMASCQISLPEPLWTPGKKIGQESPFQWCCHVAIELT